MSLREILERTQLFADSIEQREEDQIIHPYYGFNVTKTELEPVDQIQAFIAAKRIQEHNEESGEKVSFFHAFIAGGFDALHEDSERRVTAVFEKKEKKEFAKKELFLRIMKKLGIRGQVLTTRDLWSNPEYWRCLEEIFNQGLFTQESLIEDVTQFVYKGLSREEVLRRLEKKVKIKDLPRQIFGLTSALIDRIGDWPADIIYTPAEVAEALYLSRKEGVNLKIGPSRERTYDKYISKWMDILHLRQPTAMNSTRFSPKTVTPYIDKRSDKIRIFFGDKAPEIEGRISITPDEEYIYTMDDTCGSVLNPVVEKMIYCIEVARATGRVPVTIEEVELTDGEDIIRLLKGKVSTKVLKTELPRLCESLLTTL